jgi:hypothetical protein
MHRSVPAIDIYGVMHRSVCTNNTIHRYGVSHGSGCKIHRYGVMHRSVSAIRRNDVMHRGVCAIHIYCMVVCTEVYVGYTDMVFAQN